MANPQFNIVNRTSDSSAINLVFYQRFSRQQDMPIVAWRVISPQPGIPTYMPVLSNYAVYVKYKVNLAEFQTKPLPIMNLTGTYEVSRVKDRLILTTVTPDVQPGVVTVLSVPEVAVSLEPCITLGQNLVSPSQRMPPGARMSMQIIPVFYVAIVPMTVKMGAIISDQDVMATQTQILAGQTVYVNGSAADGYNLTIENP